MFRIDLLKERTQEKRCDTCNAEIPAAAPGGSCPKCLFMWAIPAVASGNLKSASREDDGDSLHDHEITDSSPSRSPESEAPGMPEAAEDSPPLQKKGAADFAPSLAEMETLFPELEIFELLGAGGMGAVFKARQKRLDRTIAVKVLSSPPGMHRDFAVRFEREAKLLAKLHHPSIVTIFDFGEAQSENIPGRPLFYFLMEYVDGSDLEERMRSGAVTVEETLSIIPQICDALQVAHDAGITHRDIKPANILLDSKGHVRVADFGVASIAESNPLSGITMTGTTMGTPHYMTPEQWDAPDTVDHRSDIYSLGVIFYEMLTGERPMGRVVPPSRRTRVNRAIDDVIFKALEKERKNRYQEAREMAADVRSAAVRLDSTPARKRTKLIAAILIPLMGLVTLIWWGLVR